MKKTVKKGQVVSWFPQLEVLAHKASGCFMTHCGWNSTLEAFKFGGANGCNATMEKSRPKWSNALFAQNIQHSTPFPKLIREMPLFCNSIFTKLSFNVKLDL